MSQSNDSGLNLDHFQWRKKPVVIEAIQWPGCRFPEPPPQWFTDAMYKKPGAVGFLMRIGDDLFIETLEGQMRAEPGDWIIQGIKGEIYPCKSDIFEASYERAALANQPAPTVPADVMSQFAAWKGYELPPMNSDGHFDKDWLHREWCAFQAGIARAAHQPAQEQAK